MLIRSLAGLAFVLAICGVTLGEEARGFLAKIEDGTITIRTGGGFGKTKTKAEEKTFKISKDVKVSKTSRDKEKEAVSLTLDELKTALKVTGGISVTVTHEGDNVSEIKVGGGFGGFRPKTKEKKSDN